MLLPVFPLSGCAASYVPPADHVLLSPSEVPTCRFSEWSVPGEPLLLRHTAFLEAGEQELVLQGLVLLDNERSKAQVVGMTELGMKLFDLTVTSKNHYQNYLSPAIGSRKKALADLIALSTRRIFLFGEYPESPDVYLGPQSFLMINSVMGSQMAYKCSATDNTLLKQFSPVQNWQAEHSGYQVIKGRYIPQRTVYQDKRAGYRLILVLHEVSAP